MNTQTIGITVGLLCHIISSFGLSLQRKSYQIPKNARYKRLWLIGFSIYLFSSLIGSLISIGSLPVTLLASLGSFQLVCNAFFAYLILNDTFSRQSLVATIIILIGAAIVAYFGRVPDYHNSLEELTQLFKRSAFIVYFGIQEIVLMAMLALTYKLETDIKNFEVGLRNTLPMNTLGLYSNKSILGLLFGIIGTLFGTQDLLCAKSGIGLLTLTIEGDNQFDKPLAWIIVIILLVTAILSIYYLNKGLEHADLVLLIPINYCVYNISILVNGLVYFNQLDYLSIFSLFMIYTGASVLSFGVYILSKKEQSDYLDKSKQDQLCASEVEPLMENDKPLIDI